MGRGSVAAFVVAGSLAASPAALARTQSAHSGDVSATFTFSAKLPPYKGEKLRLKIVRAGKTAYDARVVAKFCVTYCRPLNTGRGQTSVHAVDLEPGGEPDVVLDLFSGGAHCCDIEQIFSYDPGTMTYVKTERNFGDPGERIVDLGHNGHKEFLTANDAFAYEFTDYAASGLPIDILTFSHRRFHDVTTSYPKLIARDAAVWLKAFKSQAGMHYDDSTGVIAAWAADEDLLGQSKRVARYLAQQAKAGHLNSALSPEEPSGQKFVAKLQRFLRKLGYLR